MTESSELRYYYAMTKRPDPLAPASAAEREELANAFAPAFLEEAEPLDDPPAAVRALFSGPTSIQPVESREGILYAVVQRGEEAVLDEAGVEGSDAILGLFTDRATAGLAASVLPATATDDPFTVGDRQKRRGFPVHQNGLFLGHITHREPAFPARLHVAHTYAANLEALAHLVESLGARALVFLGRILARRLEESRQTRR